jgi:DNA-binding MarR family transcriptional regulator
MATHSRDLRPIHEPVPLPEPGTDVGFALRNLMQAFRQTVDSAIRAQRLDVSFAHGMVLKTLAREPGISGAQLARRAAVTAQSMNGLLRGMESTGLIVRERHPENRRRDCWFMTRAGFRQVEQAHDLIEEVVARMLAPISRADASRLSDLLQKCAVALQTGAESKPERAPRTRGSARGAAGRSRGGLRA